MPRKEGIEFILFMQWDFKYPREESLSEITGGGMATFSSHSSYLRPPSSATKASEGDGSGSKKFRKRRKEKSKSAVSEGYPAKKRAAPKKNDNPLKTSTIRYEEKTTRKEVDTSGDRRG